MRAFNNLSEVEVSSRIHILCINCRNSFAVPLRDHSNINNTCACGITWIASQITQSSAQDALDIHIKFQRVPPPKEQPTQVDLAMLIQELTRALEQRQR